MSKFISYSLGKFYSNADSEIIFVYLITKSQAPELTGVKMCWEDSNVTCSAVPSETGSNDYNGNNVRAGSVNGESIRSFSSC